MFKKLQFTLKMLNRFSLTSIYYTVILFSSGCEFTSNSENKDTSKEEVSNITPIITQATLSGNQNGCTNISLVDINVVATDLQEISISEDQQSLGINWQKYEPGKVYSLSLSIGEGLKNIYIVGRYASRNGVATSTTIQKSIYVDQSGPVITFLNPSADSVVGPLSLVSVSWLASDVCGVDSDSYRFEYKSANTSSAVDSDIWHPISISKNTSPWTWSLPVSSEIKYYKLRAKATDMFSNQTEKESFIFKHDKSISEVTVSEPKKYFKYKGGTELLVKWAHNLAVYGLNVSKAKVFIRTGNGSFESLGEFDGSSNEAKVMLPTWDTVAAQIRVELQTTSSDALILNPVYSNLSPVFYIDSQVTAEFDANLAGKSYEGFSYFRINVSSEAVIVKSWSLYSGDREITEFRSCGLNSDYNYNDPYGYLRPYLLCFAPNINAENLYFKMELQDQLGHVKTIVSPVFATRKSNAWLAARDIQCLSSDCDIGDSLEVENGKILISLYDKNPLLLDFNQKKLEYKHPSCRPYPSIDIGCGTYGGGYFTMLNDGRIKYDYQCRSLDNIFTANWTYSNDLSSGLCDSIQENSNTVGDYKPDLDPNFPLQKFDKTAVLPNGNRVSAEYSYLTNYKWLLKFENNSSVIMSHNFNGNKILGLLPFSSGVVVLYLDDTDLRADSFYALYNRVFFKVYSYDGTELTAPDNLSGFGTNY